MTSKLRSFWHHNKVPYLFLLPWLIGLIVLGIVPMIASLYLSFTNYDFLQHLILLVCVITSRCLPKMAGS